MYELHCTETVNYTVFHSLITFSDCMFIFLQTHDLLYILIKFILFSHINCDCDKVKHWKRGICSPLYFLFLFIRVHSKEANYQLIKNVWTLTPSEVSGILMNKSKRKKTLLIAINVASTQIPFNHKRLTIWKGSPEGNGIAFCFP